MTTIIGRSERGAARVLDASVEGGVYVHLYIHHPNGRSGASTRVALAELREAVAAPHATIVNAGSARPVFVERRGSETYMWIQGVGANGWSIFVSSEALGQALGLNGPTETSTVGSVRESKFWPIALILALAAVI